MIVLSNAAIAGSLRNVSKHSVSGEGYSGRALIDRSGSERDHQSLKLRMLYLRRRRQLGSPG